MRNDRKFARADTLISASIALAPVWWVAGLDFAAYTVLSVAAMVYLGRNPLQRNSDIIIVALIALLGGMAIAASFRGEELNRILAAAYNVAILFGGFCALSSMRSVTANGLSRDGMRSSRTLSVGRKGFIAASAIILAVFLVAAITRTYHLQTLSLLGQMIHTPLPGILHQSQILVFSRPDWSLGIPLPRVYAMAPYAPSAALLLAFLSLLNHFRLIVTGEHSIRKLLIYDCLTLMCLLATQTRTVVAGFVVGTLVASILGRGLRHMILMAVLLLSIASVLMANNQLFSDMVEFRINSTDVRFESYRLAVIETINTSPLFGLGVKPREDHVLDIPIGSHSTLISMLVKAGLLGMILSFIFFYAIPLVRWLLYLAHHGSLLRNAPVEQILICRTLFRYQIVVWIWIAFGDLDAIAVASACIMLFYGMVESWLRSRPAEVPATDRLFAVSTPALLFNR